jgi:hypothetical protein
MSIEMDDLYDQTLTHMEATHTRLAAAVKPPRLVPFGDGHVFRYVERDIHQALVQKLARVVSGLHAARLLMTRGFFQEQAALQRMLDEFNDDIVFLAHGVVSGNVTDLHQDYLAAFYEEEYDDPRSALRSTQKRPMIARQKIRAYLSRIEADGLNPSSGVEVMRTVNKVYSGFVHGASPHIMDMYGGAPPRFHVRGMLETPHATHHRDDLWNVFYRSIGSFVLAAKAFGNQALVENILECMRGFARAAGETYAHPPARWCNREHR